MASQVDVAGSEMTEPEMTEPEMNESNASDVSAGQSRRPWLVPPVAATVFDVLVVASLTLVAFLVRRGTLPTDGLWFDDSWVAAGAIRGAPRQLLWVGSGHPGFTALLMVVHRAGGSLAALGVPSLLAGIAAPALFYLALRRFDFARSIALVLAAALVVAPIHILYSGRVKSYTLDTLWILALAVALPWLARRTWRWPVAVAWFVAAITIGTLSGYALVATAGAGLVLALHPASDRILRWCAVGAQAAVQGLYYKVAQSKTDLAGIEKVMETSYDGHMSFTWNPLKLGSQILTHLGRVAEVYPGRPHGLLTVLALVSIAGLVVAACSDRDRRETIAARYFVVLVAVAFIGSFLAKFPFGTTNGPVSAGGRHTLWLVPAVAFGLAAAGQRLRQVVHEHRPVRIGVDVALVVLAIACIAGGYEHAQPAPFPGSATAMAFIERAAGPNDVVIVSASAVFSAAVDTSTSVSLVPTPDHQVGFAPVFRDPRFHATGGWAASPGTPREIRHWTAGSGDVYLLTSGPIGAVAFHRIGRVLATDHRKVSTKPFGFSVVEVWRKVPTA